MSTSQCNIDQVNYKSDLCEHQFLPKDDEYSDDESMSEYGEDDCDELSYKKCSKSKDPPVPKKPLPMRKDAPQEALIAVFNLKCIQKYFKLKLDVTQLGNSIQKGLVVEGLASPTSNNHAFDEDQNLQTSLSVSEEKLVTEIKRFHVQISYEGDEKKYQLINSNNNNQFAANGTIAMEQLIRIFGGFNHLPEDIPQRLMYSAFVRTPFSTLVDSKTVGKSEIIEELVKKRMIVVRGLCEPPSDDNKIPINPKDEPVKNMVKGMCCVATTV